MVTCCIMIIKYMYIITYVHIMVHTKCVYYFVLMVGGVYYDQFILIGSLVVGVCIIVAVVVVAVCYCVCCKNG